MREANVGLGRPYSIRGIVVRGEGRGRGLGFPTANLRVGDRDKLIPPEGIYAVRAVLRSGSYGGALHLGPRPTFKGSPPTIELHVLDFDGDLYGEEVRVDFIQHLREILPFTTVAALVEQMKADVEAARAAVDENGRLA
jgi:riboflavin kinase/FMN adenylyltransferase